MNPVATRRRMPRTIALVLCCCTALAGGAQAQAPVESKWTLGDNRGSFCIWYLIEPAMAATMVENGTSLRPAGDGKGYSGQLARFIRDDPKYAQWIPGAVCIGMFGRLSVDGKEEARAKAEKPLLLLTSMLAADGSRGVSGSGFYLMSLASDDRAFARAAEVAGFDFDGLSATVRAKSQGLDPELTVQLGKTTMIWSGHPRGETSVGTTHSMSFGYAGKRNSSWKVAVQSTPATTDTLVGAFRVVGKDRLAKALLASPIRVVSSRDMGGETVIQFNQQPRRP